MSMFSKDYSYYGIQATDRKPVSSTTYLFTKLLQMALEESQSRAGLGVPLIWNYWTIYRKTVRDQLC